MHSKLSSLFVRSIPLLVCMIVQAGLHNASQAAVIRKTVPSLARRIAGYLEKEGAETVEIARFFTPDGTSPDLKIRDLLIGELKKQGIAVRPQAAHKLEGELLVETDGSRTLMRIECHLVGNGRRRQITFRGQPGAGSRNNLTDDVLEVVSSRAVTVPFLPEVPDAERVAQGIKKPAAVVRAGTRVFSNPESPYGVEILVDRTPAAVALKGGEAEVRIGLNRAYTVRIHNNSDYDCAVQLTLDGLNCLHFCQVKEYQQLGLWIIPAGKSGVIPGWYIGRLPVEAGAKPVDQFDEFVVVPAAKAAVAGLGAPAADVGTITCQFFAAWEGNNRPPIELAGIQGEGKGTGVGRRVQGPEVEKLVRFIGRTLQSAVSIRLK